MKKTIIAISLFSSLIAYGQINSNWQSCHYSEREGFHCHNGIDNHEHIIIPEVKPGKGNNNNIGNNNIPDNDINDNNDNVCSTENILNAVNPDLNLVNDCNKTILNVANETHTSNLSITEKSKIYSYLLDKTETDFHRAWREDKQSVLVVRAFNLSEEIFLKACSHHSEAYIQQLKKPIVNKLKKYKDQTAFHIPRDFEKIIKKNCSR